MLAAFSATAAGRPRRGVAWRFKFMKIMSAQSMNSRCTFAFPCSKSNPYRRTGCRHIQPQYAEQHLRRYDMKWEKPAASDMRFGFEITMYIANR
jgi:pyrroloquinoline quinone biosynthesis protein A